MVVLASFLVATPEDTEIRVGMAERARQIDDDIACLTRMRDSLPACRDPDDRAAPLRRRDGQHT